MTTGKRRLLVAALVLGTSSGLIGWRYYVVERQLWANDLLYNAAYHDDVDLARTGLAQRGNPLGPASLPEQSETPIEIARDLKHTKVLKILEEAAKDHR